MKPLLLECRPSYGATLAEEMREQCNYKNAKRMGSYCPCQELWKVFTEHFHNPSRFMTLYSPQATRGFTKMGTKFISL